MLYYLIEKHMQKIQALLMGKKFHLKKSLTSLLHQAIQLGKGTFFPFKIDTF